MASLEIKGNNPIEFIPTSIRPYIEQQFPILSEEYKIGLYTGEDVNQQIVLSPIGALGIVTEAANEAGNMVVDKSLEYIEETAEESTGLTGLVVSGLSSTANGVVAGIRAAPPRMNYFKNPIKTGLADLGAIGIGLQTMLGREK